MRHTVLIIDDDPLLVTLQKKLTQRIGPVDVAHADDGFQALHFLAEIEPDIVFLDIDMPGLDGWLLCEILHKVDRWAHIPIILQSALVGEENIKRGLSLGAKSYIEKPFTEDKLRQVLERYLPQEEDESEAADPLGSLPPLVKNLAEAAVQVLNLVSGSTPTPAIDDNPNSELANAEWEHLIQFDLKGGDDVSVEMAIPYSTLSAASAILHPDDPPIELTDELKPIAEMLAEGMIANSKRLSPMRADNFTTRSNDILSPIKESSHLISLQAGEVTFPLLLTPKV
jgi:CheY-like chemotaxis protein